jgi:hypothetical protein
VGNHPAFRTWEKLITTLLLQNGIHDLKHCLHNPEVMGYNLASTIKITWVKILLPQSRIRGLKSCFYNLEPVDYHLAFSARNITKSIWFLLPRPEDTGVPLCVFNPTPRRKPHTCLV